MLTKRSITAPILATFITFSPAIAMAAEDSFTSSLPPIWPFLAFVLFVIVFRKQLNCVPPFEPQDEISPPVIEEKNIPESEQPAPTEIIATDTSTVAEPEVEVKEVEVKTEVNDNIIDLKDGGQQCQASTAKGTRCKRKTTLEDTSISLDGKTYLLTVCRQHNTDHLKPCAELL